MVFHNPQTRQVKELRAGVQARTFWGENFMFSLVELQAQAVIPAHGHPHEQDTYVVSGGFDVAIGEETRWVGGGELFIVPGGVEHSVRVGPEATRVVDVFAPAREDLKY